MTLMERGPIPRRCDRMHEAARAAVRPDCRCEQSHDIGYKGAGGKSGQGWFDTIKRQVQELYLRPGGKARGCSTPVELQMLNSASSGGQQTARMTS
jgi:hypothetical protein